MKKKTQTWSIWYVHECSKGLVCVFSLRRFKNLSINLCVFEYAYMLVCVCDCVFLSAELILCVNEAWWDLGVSRSTDRTLVLSARLPHSLSFRSPVYSSGVLSPHIHQIACFYPLLPSLPPFFLLSSALPTPSLTPLRPNFLTPLLPSIHSISSSSGVEIFISSATCESKIILHY